MIKEAVVLAGGKSSRMGKDKALLPFGDKETLTLYQYNRLSKIFDRVYISSKSNKFGMDIDIIEDKIKDISSPMVALEAILSTIEYEAVFVLGVDIPFISKKIIDTLINRCKRNKIIVAKSPNGLEPLVAVYPKSILPTIRELIEKDEHRLHTLLSIADMESVEFKDIEAFLNLNKPSDYKKALKLLKGIKYPFQKS